MDRDIRIRVVRRQQRDLLIEMYERFEPLGLALGLPPRENEARREWIEVALSQKMNLGALSPAGTAVGHCFVVADKTASAELTIFVRQEFRRRGIATALVKAMLEWGCILGLRRIWALTGSENRIALRLLDRFGFRQMRPGSCGAEELELHLPGACAPREIASDRSSATGRGCGGLTFTSGLTLPVFT
jgi:RimJ/RimL family protein N-acetyltransferase